MNDRLKRLKFQCDHMGMQENDVIFGRFAERHLESLSDEQVEKFDALIRQNDVDLFKWITGKEETPVQFQNEIIEMLRGCQDVDN